MTDYVGIIDQTGETWGVRIPDLPGCYGAGDSAENAIRDAASAAREWIAHQEGSGLARPKARAMSEILAAGEVDVAAGEAAVLIGVLVREESPEAFYARLSASSGEDVDLDALIADHRGPHLGSDL